MSAFELLKSRIGSRGEDGVTFTRRFLVTAPDPLPAKWNPLVDDDLIRLARLGTEFLSLRGALCRNYIIEEQHDKSHWTVIADYGIPSTLDPGFGGGWRVEITGSLDVAHTDVERLTEAEQSADPYVPPRVVGPFLYKRKDSVPQPQPEHVFFAEYTVGPNKAGVVELFTENPPFEETRVVEGMEWYPPTMTVVCSKKFGNVDTRRVALLASHHGYVNSKSVNILGRVLFEPRQLMLADYRISEVESGIPEVPFVQDITVAWSARPHSWQHEVVHTYSDDNVTGTARGIVWLKEFNPGFPDFEAERPVKETFRRQFETDFNGFLEALG